MPKQTDNQASRPQLTFFCELSAAALAELFASPWLAGQLRELGATLSLGILDLSDQRATVVRQLNQAGVPVTAWQLLPKEQGYWYNLDNAQHAAARYEEFCAWTAAHQLRWAGIGIDIEPDIREMERMAGNSRQLLPLLLRRALDTARMPRARQAYSALIGRMHADGYAVESYIMPYVLDDRRAGSTLLQRISGIIDLPVDREVPMLYTSFIPRYPAGTLWSYLADAGPAVALGITGGGVEFEQIAPRPPLSWQELRRDLLLARQRCAQLYIFSLEGCVQQGLLEPLLGFDWAASQPPPAEARYVEWLRAGLRAGLVGLRYTLPASGLALAIWLARRARS